MFKNILLAADGSAHSLQAAETAIKLASYHQDSKVVVLYVVDGSTSKADVLRNWSTSGIMEKRKEKMRLIEQKAKEKGISYDIKIVRGEPASTIIQYANDGMDVVVIGSRGLNALQEMVLGSVSHRVAQKARCPVVIVK
jgi:nucleotide-binding universal stress UspA family protein